MGDSIDDQHGDDRDATRRVRRGPGATSSAAPIAAVTPGLPERYEPLELIGRGGWGEIHRVRDRVMDRIVAMKLLSLEHLGSPRVLGRFMNEATITASLEHPGIVPVHDRGHLADGRPWFTMKEVRGRTLAALLREANAGPAAERDPTRTRRLIDVFARICETVGYAHQRDIVHRDLKPGNVMLGEFGEVLVLDWGIACRRGERAASEAGAPSPSPSDVTQPGDVLGTVNYMSPEQARAANELVDPRSDVFSLGLVLYEILVGRPARSGAEMRAWVDASRALVPTISDANREALVLSDELAAVYARAVEREPADRFPDARELGEAVRAWLDGAARHDRAAKATIAADAITPRIDALRSERDSLCSEAMRLLEGVQPHDPVEKKIPAWRLEDVATQIDHALARAEAERIELLRGALEDAPGHLPAHRRLAEVYRSRLLDAEARHAVADAARFEVLLRRHDRGEHARFLAGTGALALDSDPTGARVRVLRYELVDRRLVEHETGVTGTTPFSCELRAGSYVVVLEHDGRPATRLAVRIARDAAWDGTRPGASRPTPVRLSPPDLGDDDVLVPAGWTDVGGDEHASEPVPPMRVWIDDVVVKRFPVTCREYLSFLDATHATGADATRYAPRWPRGAAPDEPLAVVRVDGRYVMKPDVHDVAVDPDWPIVQVDWRSARAYARWLAQTTGQPWRLPNELEWEKAASGVDQRPFPWGTQPEPTWARLLGSTADAPTRAPVTGYPFDTTPYGVRGTAGNVREWCENVWAIGGPPLRNRVLLATPSDPNDLSPRTIRGGSWHAVPAAARAACRFAAAPGERLSGVGFRLVRSLNG